MSKKITRFSYLYSIFNKKEFLEMDKCYNKFMINRFLFSINNPTINEIIHELNDSKHQNMSDADHYYILYNTIPKGFYKIPDKLVFTKNTEWNKLKQSLSQYAIDEQLKMSDVTYILSLMTDEECDKLYERIELLKES